jgi:hypothetical protein
LRGVSLKPISEVLAGDFLNKGLRFGVSQLGLRLALKLRFAKLDRHHRGKTLPDIISGEVFILFLQ